MASYRIGYDMTILWSINDRMGAAVPLEDKVVNLYYICDRGRFKADIQIQDGNVIVWDFPGIKQRYLGSYGLTVEILQSGGKRIIRKDIQEAFELVSASYMEKNDNGGANISDKAIITLSSELDIYRISPIVPEIGENNNWWVDGVDTGKAATINKEELDKKADKTELTELAENLDKKADKTEIPTKLSDLEKDIDFSEAYYITSFDKSLLYTEIPDDGKYHSIPCQEHGLTEAIKNKKSIRLLGSLSYPENGYYESVKVETDDFNYLVFSDGVHVISVDVQLDGSEALISRELLITKDNINANLESDVYYITSFDYQGILRGILHGDNRIQCYEPNLYQAVKDYKAIRLFVDMRYHDGYYEASSAVIDDFIYLTFENETSKFVLDILYDGSDLTFSIYDDTEIREELSRLEINKADKSELTELSEGISKKQDALVSGENIKTINGTSIIGSGNIEVAGQDIFVAVYGETKFEEIVAAYNRHQHVICLYNSNMYSLFNLAPNNDAYFTGINDIYTYRIVCRRDSVWYQGLAQLETSNNKVTSLSASSTDTQYPSAKAVYDFVGKQGVIRQTQTWTQAADKSYSYVMTDLVRGAIPQANLDLFLQFEKVSFNEQTGYFEIGDLTDISYEEMLKIYKTQIVTVDLTCKWLSKRVRTTISNLGRASVDNGGAQISIGNAWNTSYVESIDLLENTSPTAAFRVKGAGSAFMRASRLKEIRNVMRFDLDNPYTNNDFVGCYSLESVRAVLSAKDFSFKDSARLTYESVKYMIGKSNPATKITLTLHATALANAEAAYLVDAEQDLATYPTLSDWALSKNIQIATA